MQYVLMNKNRKVFRYKVDELTNTITKIDEVINEKYLPYSLTKNCDNLSILFVEFQSWLMSRFQQNTNWYKRQNWSFEDLKLNHDTYKEYINTLTSHGIADAKAKIQKMILLDVIMANSDRHLNNFGVIRDVNTLKWLDVAPIYDTGRSLATDIPKLDNYEGKIKELGLNTCIDDALQLIKDLKLSQEQITKLKNISNIYEEYLTQYYKYTYLNSEEQLKKVVNIIKKNINKILSLYNKKNY